MRGKRELPQKRPPILLFVLIFAAGFLAGTLFWHFYPSDASVPSGGTVTLPEDPAETDVSSEPEIPPAPPQDEEPSAEPTPFVISFLGDCTLTSSHHTSHFEKLVGDDYAYPFSNVAELLLADDLTLANLECSFSPRRLESDSEYAFCGDPNYVQALVLGGVEAVTLSNNHTYDKGASGIAATLQFWESMPEDVVTTGLWCGEEDYDRIPLQTVNGVTIAYLSYTEHTNGIRQNKNMTANVIYTSQTNVIEHQVRLARQQADFVVVGVHWGVENSHAVVDSQRTLAQNLADWGADVIVGTHPHVLQDAQWLSAADGRQTFVAYSLGNFLSTQNRPDQLVGAILNLQLQKTTEPDGTVQCAVLEPKLLPTVTHYDAGKSNVRTYLFRDYTQELAKQHGVRAKHSDFSLDTVQKIAQNNISSDFLKLT